MKVFLSYSSRDKALVREVRSHLPRHIQTWLDEDDLLWSQNLTVSIKEAITQGADYFVIFLDREAIRSDWVRREFEWALERERQLARTFVLPVLLDDCWGEVQPAAFQERKYLKCLDQSVQGVRSLAEAMSSQIFAHLAKNLHERERKEMEAERQGEAVKAAAHTLTGIVDVFAGIQREWKTDLVRRCTNFSDFAPERQLEKIAEIIDAELRRWRASDQEELAPVEDDQATGGQEGIEGTMAALTKFAGVVVGVVDRERVGLLEEVNQLLVAWNGDRANVEAATVLGRVISRLKEAEGS